MTTSKSVSLIVLSLGPTRICDHSMFGLGRSISGLIQAFIP
jgi:hypothetical protein